MSGREIPVCRLRGVATRWCADSRKECLPGRLDRIISILDWRNPTLDRIVSTLDRHDPMLNRIISMLDWHDPILDRIISILDWRNPTRDRIVSTLDRHDPTLNRIISMLDWHDPILDRIISTLDRRKPTLDQAISIVDRRDRSARPVRLAFPCPFPVPAIMDRFGLRAGTAFRDVRGRLPLPRVRQSPRRSLPRMQVERRPLHKDVDLQAQQADRLAQAYFGHR